jgi:hypothetical protein
METSKLNHAVFQRKFSDQAHVLIEDKHFKIGSKGKI